MKATATGISLKPYLLAVKEHCESLSKQELVETLLEMAQETPAGSRTEFLDKLHVLSPRFVSKEEEIPLDVEAQLLERIAELQEEIETRIESIEDGTYWDDYEGGYDEEEEPESVTEDQSSELEQLFLDAGDLFMDDHLDAAQRVYRALFDFLNANEYISSAYLPALLELREARARYCRCVYETADPARLLDDFYESMAVDATMNTYRLDLSRELFPMLRDVVDARVEKLNGWEWFLPAWEKKLAICNSARAAILRMEALQWLEGGADEGISRLAREWKSEQPYGYLFWIQHLEACENWHGVRDACLEAMKVLPHGGFREQATESLIKAAMVLGDKVLLLLGKRECFLSVPKQTNLFELLHEAEKQNLRSQELDVILAFKGDIKKSCGYTGFYLEILLMAGRLEDAFHEGSTEKSVGWSSGKAGILFASILSVLTGNNHKTVTIQSLLKEHARNFSGEIIKGLMLVSLTESKKQQYLVWADNICRERVEQIVSNQHRNAYDRAARAMGAVAECYVHLNKKDNAIRLLNEFIRIKFPRHSAFRAEVKRVVNGSALLKSLQL